MSLPFIAFLGRVNYDLEREILSLLLPATDMSRKSIWAIGILSSLPLVAFAQSVPDVSKLRLNVVAEQKDATLHFTLGSIAAIGGGDDFNGFTGTSSDMGGGTLQTVILLDQNVSDDRVAILASFQRRLEGTVKCKRIRRGDSPDAPSVHVLADGCAIVSLNH